MVDIVINVITERPLVNRRDMMAAPRPHALVLVSAASHTVTMARPLLRTVPFRDEFDAPPSARACDHPGCGATGEFRAPRSRTLNDYYWFCLDHVRSYNASWNYYAGMNEAEIETELRKDMVGQRPSWKFGTRVAWRYGNAGKDSSLFDFEAEVARERPAARPPTPQETALRTFDLSLPLTLAAVKAR
jgi:hypothetical protein